MFTSRSLHPRSKFQLSCWRVHLEPPLRSLHRHTPRDLILNSRLHNTRWYLLRRVQLPPNSHLSTPPPTTVTADIQRMMNSNKLVLLPMINTHCYFSKGGQVLSLTHSMTQTSVLYSLYLEPTIKHKLLRTRRTLKPKLKARSDLKMIYCSPLSLEFPLLYHIINYNRPI